MDRVPELIDAHVHVWDLARRPQSWIDPLTMSAIDRTFDATELQTTLADVGVIGSVLVQVLNREDETLELLKVAKDSTVVAAVVGWSDVAAPTLGDTLDRLGEVPGGELLTGVRHQALAEPDPAEWLAQPEMARGLQELARRDLAFDLMFGASHLDEVRQFVSRVDDLAFVLDHAGKPPISQGWDSDAARRWARDIRRLARSGAVHCKLSGLTVMAAPPWTVDDLRPFVSHLLETFGPKHLIYGSDWPVSLRAGSYRSTLTAMRDLVGELSPPEQVAIFGGNARRVYRIVQA